MVRRVVDVVLGTILSLVTLPLVLVMAIVAAVALRSWPFFVQERIGLNGRPFRFVKLRTLPRTAPKYAGKYLVQTIETPPVCRWFRSMHLDELPQLWLVVTGKMTLVGPRPEMGFLHAQLEPEFARRRTSVLPGCTGLWQIGTRCQNMIFEHPEFDDYYLRNRSASFDMWILLRTAGLMLPGRNRRLVSLPELAQTRSAASRAAPVRAERQLEPAET